MITYLALGDSYTIGEQVELHQSFPHQLSALLNEQGVPCAEPVIIATTGWTTDELLAAIQEKNITETFSIVTLLIGVNNQYRGRSVENYAEEFTTLLQHALSFVQNNPKNVFILSIPDWGGTPFAEGKDAQVISEEIDAYNGRSEAICRQHNCSFISITDSTRNNVGQPGFLVADGLHPSEKEYAIWAARVLPFVQQAIEK